MSGLCGFTGGSGTQLLDFFLVAPFDLLAGFTLSINMLAVFLKLAWLEVARLVARSGEKGVSAVAGFPALRLKVL